MSACLNLVSMEALVLTKSMDMSVHVGRDTLDATAKEVRVFR